MNSDKFNEYVTNLAYGKVTISCYSHRTSSKANILKKHNHACRKYTFHKHYLL